MYTNAEGEKITKSEFFANEIEEKIQPAIVEGFSLPQYQFFCYKNFLTGLVRVKVNNFESILRSTHNYPLQKLKLVLKLGGSSLYLEADKSKSPNTPLDIENLEKVSSLKDNNEPSVERDQQQQPQADSEESKI